MNCPFCQNPLLINKAYIFESYQSCEHDNDHEFIIYSFGTWYLIIYPYLQFNEVQIGRTPQGIHYISLNQNLQIIDMLIAPESCLSVLDKYLKLKSFL